MAGLDPPSAQRGKKGLDMSGMNRKLEEKVAASFKLRYRVEMNELEITDAPGYWRDKQPKMHPEHPLHGCIGCDGPFKASYQYLDPPRKDNGQFASQTRTWARLRANATERKT